MPDDDPNVVHIAVDAAVLKVLIDRLEARQLRRPTDANRIALRHARICAEWVEVRDEREAVRPIESKRPNGEGA